VYALSFRFVPATRSHTAGTRLDIAGAVTVTASLMLAVYGIVDGNHAGWSSAQTLGLLGGAVGLLVIFLVIEARIAHPLMPLRLFRLRSVTAANILGALWAAAMFGCFFLSALYMQLVLGYDPMQVGLAFLPSNLIMAAFSIGWSAKVVMRYGLRLPIVVGMLLTTIGLALFALAPVNGGFWLHILPGMLLIGVGCGMALNPVMLAAMNDVAPEESGLASGVVNTAFMMGGALGLAVLVSLAAARSGGVQTPEALTSGYHAAFVVSAMFALVAAMVAAWLPRTPVETSKEAEWATP
jgi:predicted MFS family arabinose efflux permease